MHEQLRVNLAQFVNLTDKEFDCITSRLTHRALQKNEILLRAGQVCQDAFFINQGCLRYFYLTDGEEKTGQFFFENDWYTDFVSFVSGKPSEENIQALEASSLLVLSRPDLLDLFDQIPKFERFGRLTAEQAVLGIKARNAALINQSPEQRYLRLLKNRPKVVARLPQHYIASFLNIKPESLSRIRKRLADNRRS